MIRPRRAFLLALVAGVVFPWPLWLVAYAPFHRKGGDVIWWLAMVVLLSAAVASAVGVRWYYLVIGPTTIGVVFGPWRRTVSRADVAEIRKRVSLLTGRPSFDLLLADGRTGLNVSALAFTGDQMQALAARLQVPFETRSVQT
jgi:hypothetical protein